MPKLLILSAEENPCRRILEVENLPNLELAYSTADVVDILVKIFIENYTTTVRRLFS